jgi:preprotein translocase subunit SecD
VTFEIRRVLDEADRQQSDTFPFAKNSRNSEGALRVSKEVALNQSDVASAKTQKNPLSGQPEVLAKLTTPGSHRFAKITKDSVGKRLAVISNGKILSAPVIREEIAGGSLVISGTFDEQEAANLAETLNGRKNQPANN